MSNCYITILRNSHFHQQCTPQALTNIRVFYKPAVFQKTEHPAEGGQRPQPAGSWCYLPTLASCCLFFSSTQCLPTTQVLEVRGLPLRIPSSQIHNQGCGGGGSWKSGRTHVTLGVVTSNHLFGLKFSSML